MAKGYWVVFADVTDPDGYKGYMAANAKALAQYGGRFLARGGKVEPKEGKPRSRVVVVEFPSYSAALECYRSPEYVSAMKERPASGIKAGDKPFKVLGVYVIKAGEPLAKPAP